MAFLASETRCVFAMETKLSAINHTLYLSLSLSLAYVCVHAHTQLLWWHKMNGIACSFIDGIKSGNELSIPL